MQLSNICYFPISSTSYLSSIRTIFYNDFQRIYEHWIYKSALYLHLLSHTDSLTFREYFKWFTTTDFFVFLIWYFAKLSSNRQIQLNFNWVGFNFSFLPSEGLLGGVFKINFFFSNFWGELKIFIISYLEILKCKAQNMLWTKIDCI